jgi:RNA polymerase sigma-70 factor, ECF subfamily
VSVLAENFDSRDSFLADAQRYRRELLAHCYRMTGSLHDAEDLVQETYLRAWKSFEGFEGRSSIRTWLYRIATNTCLTALESRQRRPLPSGLGAPSSDPTGAIAEHPEITWLEPLPDVPGEHPSDPSVIVASRDSVRLAFVAALQHLPARQRAVLVLREVLQWKAAEVGEAIGVSTAAVNSLLQRARAQLDEIQPSADDDVTAPESPEARELLAKYVAAFETYDMEALARLFTEDAIFEMPPFDGWYRGPHDIVMLSKTHCPAQGAGDMRFISTTANDQPAAALYMLNRETGRHEEFQLHVLQVRSGGVSHVVAFHAGDGMFARFGLPEFLPVT